MQKRNEEHCVQKRNEEHCTFFFLWFMPTAKICYKTRISRSMVIILGIEISKFLDNTVWNSEDLLCTFYNNEFCMCSDQEL